MKSIHLRQIPEEERQSPKEVYHLFQRNISLALGGKKDTGVGHGGHPFDLAAVRIPPGENHQIENSSSQELVYLVIADMPVADHITYPDTNRIFIKPERKLLGETFEHYYAGHE